MRCSSRKLFQSKQTNEWISSDTRVQPFADIYKQGTPEEIAPPYTSLPKLLQISITHGTGIFLANTVKQIGFLLSLIHSNP